MIFILISCGLEKYPGQSTHKFVLEFSCGVGLRSINFLYKVVRIYGQGNEARISN